MPIRRPHRPRRLAEALLAVTGGTPTHPHWVTPDDLWRDRLAVLAEQDAWPAAWGPRPGEPECRVPPGLLPESQARREDIYLMWCSAVRVSANVDSESKTVRKPRPRHRDDTKQRPIAEELLQEPPFERVPKPSAHPSATPRPLWL
jgi:hypothetical protein